MRVLRSTIYKGKYCNFDGWELHCDISVSWEIENIIQSILQILTVTTTTSYVLKRSIVAHEFLDNCSEKARIHETRRMYNSKLK